MKLTKIQLFIHLKHKTQGTTEGHVCGSQCFLQNFPGLWRAAETPNVLPWAPQKPCDVEQSPLSHFKYKCSREEVWDGQSQTDWVFSVIGIRSPAGLKVTRAPRECLIHGLNLRTRAEPSGGRHAIRRSPNSSHDHGSVSWVMCQAHTGDF